MLTGAKYARGSDVNIACQVVGDGPVDLVLTFGWVSHIALVWELPAIASFLNRLASFTRLILYDKRGTGMSDRVHPDNPGNCPDHDAAIAGLATSVMPGVYGTDPLAVPGHDHLVGNRRTGDYNTAWHDTGITFLCPIVPASLYAKGSPVG